MPNVRAVDSVQDKIREGDRVDKVRLLPAPERVLAKSLQSVGRRSHPEPGTHPLEGLREKAAGPTARVVYRLADLGIDRPDHCSNDLAWREELAAVVVLLPHLQE